MNNLNEFNEKVASKYKHIDINQINPMKLIPIDAKSKFDPSKVPRRFRITDNVNFNKKKKKKKKFFFFDFKI